MEGLLDSNTHFTEIDALTDSRLSNEARVLYLLGIRLYVNPDGCVGDGRKSSYLQGTSACQLLSQYRHEDGAELGHKPVFEPTSGQLKGYWAQLEKVGLIEKTDQIGSGGKPVYKLPLVDLERVNLAAGAVEAEWLPMVF